jgi:TonB-dependent SusC/RagA subfamily outer membrane receptor
METYLIYIGKSAIAAGAFYIAFLLLFQNQKHFTFNRIFLPVSLALSFVIPLITFTTIKYIEPVNFDANSFAYLAPASGEIVQPAFVIEWYHYLFGLYLLGTAGFLFHLLLGHLKAIKIIQKSRVQKIFNNLVNITQKDVHPFSFFSKIVVSEKTLSHPELEMIVSHENIHVREKHTLDILFTEIMFLLQWFNPFAWLLKDAVKNNLEYLTDNEIALYYNPQTYQLAMVTLADKQGIAPFLTALNGSQLKNRIVMMKKKTENKFAIVKQLAVLPLLAILVMGLSNKEVKTEIVQTEQTTNLSKNANIHVVKPHNSVKGKVTDRITGSPVADARIVLEDLKIETTTDLNGNYEIEFGKNEKPVLMAISANEYYTNTVVYYGVNDNLNVTLDKIADTNGTQKFTVGKENKYIVSGKVTNENGEPLSGANVLIKGTTSGTITDSKGNFKLNVENQTTTLLISMIGYDETEVKLDGINEFKIELKKDGVPHSYEIKFDETKKSDEIEVVGYQSKESKQPQSGGFTISGGMNGTMQKGSENFIITPSSQNGLIIRATGGLNGEPLYVVDGIETTTTNLNKLSPDSIESISVLKDKSATTLYGDKGKNGVVVITTKKYSQNNKSGEVVVTGYGYNSALLGNPAPFGTTTGKTNQPLIIVNDKESGQTLNNIDPAKIESVNVLKDETATKKYGEKGKNGVLEITLKNDKTKNDSYFELRKSIAQNIKYPVLAQENNQQGVVEVWASIAKDGTISRIIDKRPDGKFINVDEVVVTSYKSEKAVTSEKSKDLSLLVKESTRVIEKLSPLNIPELAGEMVCFRIKFVLE